MKYFFLALLLLCILAVGIGGFRGDKTTERPIEIFPDMDVQDKILAQSDSNFFHDGQGPRLPVDGSVPHASDDGVFPVEFGEGRTGYYYTGAIDDYYAHGMPEELGLDGDNIDAFLRRGRERYAIFCTACHGSSGNGQGVTTYYGMAGVANLHEARFLADQYPDGRVYDVITNGKGLMGAYGASIPVRDRWAIVAYLRVMQAAKQDPSTGSGPAGGGPSESTTASN